MDAPNETPVANSSWQAGANVAAWERRPGEPVRWLARFNIYRLLGSGRSIDAAWRQEQRAKTNKNGRAPDSWHKAAKRFEWRERALIWDVADAERAGQEILEERARRLKRALNHRRRREGYIDGLERTLRQHTENVLSKLNPSSNAPAIEWYEARVAAHFSFIERMMRLAHSEYAVEERLLAEIASHQQRRCPLQSVILTDGVVAATVELDNAKTTHPLLNRGGK